MHYKVIDRTEFSEDHGEYLAYGLLAEGEAPGVSHVKIAINDISTDKQEVEKMAHLFETHQLSYLHFQDAVEDML